MTAAEILAAVRVDLREAAASNWTDAELASWQAKVLREMAARESLIKQTLLPITEYTRDVDISSITSSAFKIAPQVIYPVSYYNNQPIWRNYTRTNDILTLDINDLPSIKHRNTSGGESDHEGTLTGTVTFTQNSRTVTGSGTAFTTELNSNYDNGFGDLIGKSSGSRFYQVAHVASDTSLTLAEPFAETTGADTVNVTKSRTVCGCVLVYYGTNYTVSTTSNLPLRHDSTLITGIVANAALNYASNYIQVKLADVTTKLATSVTSAGNATARITQGIADLATNRVNLAADLTAYAALLAEAETALDYVVTDLASGRAVVNTINQGGVTSTRYFDAAKVSVDEAKTRVDKARSYLESAKTSHDYIDTCVQELAAGGAYINQAGEYVKMIEQDVNSGALARNYQSWANQKWAEYQTALNKMGTMNSINTSSRSI